MLKKVLKSVAVLAMLAVLTVTLSPTMPAQAQAHGGCPDEAGFELRRGGIIISQSETIDARFRLIDKNGDGYFCQKVVKEGFCDLRSCTLAKVVNIDSNVPERELVEVPAEILEVEVVDGVESVVSSEAAEINVTTLEP